MTNQNKALEKLKAQQKKLHARIQKLEMKEKEVLRKKEMRRKIIVGEFILKNARQDNTLTQLIKTLEPHLKRKGDRALFGLEEIQTSKSEFGDDA